MRDGRDRSDCDVARTRRLLAPSPAAARRAPLGLRHAARRGRRCRARHRDRDRGDGRSARDRDSSRAGLLATSSTGSGTNLLTVGAGRRSSATPRRCPTTGRARWSRGSARCRRRRRSTARRPRTSAGPTRSPPARRTASRSVAADATCSTRSAGRWPRRRFLNAATARYPSAVLGASRRSGWASPSSARSAVWLGDRWFTRRRDPRAAAARAATSTARR